MPFRIRPNRPQPDPKDTYTASPKDTGHTCHCTCPGQYTDAPHRTACCHSTQASHIRPSRWPTDRWGRCTGSLLCNYSSKRKSFRHWHTACPRHSLNCWSRQPSRIRRIRLLSDPKDSCRIRWRNSSYRKSRNTSFPRRRMYSYRHRSNSPRFGYMSVWKTRTYWDRTGQNMNLNRLKRLSRYIRSFHRANTRRISRWSISGRPDR